VAGALLDHPWVSAELDHEPDGRVSEPVEGEPVEAGGTHGRLPHPAPEVAGSERAEVEHRSRMISPQRLTAPRAVATTHRALTLGPLRGGGRPKNEGGRADVDAFLEQSRVKPGVVAYPLPHHGE
jgi:hypothetical protein